MKKIEDLVSSATTVHARYSASRMERETVREWVLGLGEYPQPYAAAIVQAKEWFKPVPPESEFANLREQDIQHLFAIADAQSIKPSR